MIEKGDAAIRGNRIHWLDNLRTCMIFLVILFHAGLVYESSGISAFFWIVDDPSTNDLSGIFNLIIDIFAMPTIFFISGFFAPLSLRNKKGLVFLKSKFKRLIVPWFIAVFTLIPLYKVIFLYSRSLPQEDWTTYFHWSTGTIWSQNWLWFLPALFLFDGLYLLLSKVNIDMPRLSLKTAVWSVFLISLTYSFCMDVFSLQGWTKTLLIDFQNERILIYFMVFLLGSLCYKLKTFDSKWKNKKLYVAINCVSWIPINLYLFLIIYSLIYPGNYLFSAIVDAVVIRLSFLLSMVCLLYVSIQTFRYYLDKQGAIGKELSRNSYSVYVIHVVVMGAVALAMLNTAIPSLLKHLILAVATFAVGNLLVSLYRKASRRLIKENYSNLNRRLTHWKTSG
jgi:surface polysaccharide O-acyltransferase-like enzyme